MSIHFRDFAFSGDYYSYLYSYSTPSITMSLSSHHSYPHLPLHHYQHSPVFSYSLIWGTFRWVMQTSLECPLLLFITSYKTFFMLNISCFLFLIFLISISDARCQRTTGLTNLANSSFSSSIVASLASTTGTCLT